MHINSILCYSRRGSVGFSYDSKEVVDVDTSIDNALKDSNQSVSLKSSLSTYLDSENPVRLYGNGILLSEYDPHAAKLSKKNKSAHSASSVVASQDSNLPSSPSGSSSSPLNVTES